jgi:hypothetical protein
LWVPLYFDPIVFNLSNSTAMFEPSYTEDQIAEYLASISRQSPANTFWMVAYDGPQIATICDAIVKNGDKNFTITAEHDGQDWVLPYVLKVNGAVAFRSHSDAMAQAEHRDLKALVEKWGADWEKHQTKQDGFWE